MKARNSLVSIWSRAVRQAVKELIHLSAAVGYLGQWETGSCRLCHTPTCPTPGAANPRNVSSSRRDILCFALSQLGLLLQPSRPQNVHGLEKDSSAGLKLEDSNNKEWKMKPRRTKLCRDLRRRMKGIMRDIRKSNLSLKLETGPSNYDLFLPLASSDLKS